MATARLKAIDLEVHQVTGDAGTNVQTAYGVITVPRDHYIIYFPGQMELATALPPDTYAEMFEATPDAATAAPAPDTAAPAAPATDTAAPAPATATPTAPADATAPTTAPTDVAAPAPEAAPTDMTTAPTDTTAPTATPTPTDITTAPAPAQADVTAWVEGHYAPEYRQRVLDRLLANPTRAQELLNQYPLPQTAGQAPPADQI